jgi:purine-cytosine permease-like protein
MSAASPNPMNILLWGGVLIAGYWVVTRSAAASQLAATDQSRNMRNASYAQALGGILGGVFGRPAAAAPAYTPQYVPDFSTYVPPTSGWAGSYAENPFQGVGL